MLCPGTQRLDQRPARWLSQSKRSARPLPLVRRWFWWCNISRGTYPWTFLNNLQQQAYRLNPAILAVANWAYDTKRTIGKFICDDLMDRPSTLRW